MIFASNFVSIFSLNVGAVAYTYSQANMAEMIYFFQVLLLPSLSLSLSFFYLLLLLLYAENVEVLSLTLSLSLTHSRPRTKSEKYIYINVRQKGHQTSSYIHHLHKFVCLSSRESEKVNSMMMIMA